MTGLCNVCDKVGAQNWKKLFELIEMLGKEINGDTTSVEDEQEDEFEDEDIDQTTVTMIDIIFYKKNQQDIMLFNVKIEFPKLSYLSNFCRQTSLLLRPSTN